MNRRGREAPAVIAPRRSARPRGGVNVLAVDLTTAPTRALVVVVSRAEAGRCSRAALPGLEAG
jgi:hypothetical protein